MNILYQNQYELQNTEHYSSKKTKTNLGSQKKNVFQNNTEFGNDDCRRKR